MKTLRLILIISMLAGCAIEDYELKALADKCGSYDDLRSVWVDMTTPSARCKDGKKVEY